MKRMNEPTGQGKQTTVHYYRKFSPTLASFGNFRFLFTVRRCRGCRWLQTLQPQVSETLVEDRR